MIGDNLLLRTDSYKQTHWKFYPPDLSYMTSYLEARAGGEYDKVVFFGLQYQIKRYLEGRVVTQTLIEEADAFCKAHFGADYFNRAGWEHVLYEHGGQLPVVIKAVPEGTIVPESNVLLTIQNTCGECPFVVNFVETLLVQLWYPCTVATISWHIKQEMRRALDATGRTDNLPYMLHDFGYRGATSVEGAAIGGAAHLLNFMGTDTLAAIELLREYYNEPDVSNIGRSVAATEHSTMCAWGEKGERRAIQQILETITTGVVSIVSDSYDVDRVIRDYLSDNFLVDIIGNSDRRVVVRPDSGDPAEMIVNCLERLENGFGSIVNAKGFRVLPDCIRLLYGDGINRRSIPKIMQAVTSAGFALENVLFGSGGGLLQDCNRDTQRFAMKCNRASTGPDGDWYPVFKRPASDSTKNSKSGALCLIRDRVTNELSTADIRDVDWRRYAEALRVVFKDGTIYCEDTLTEIRARTNCE